MAEDALGKHGITCIANWVAGNAMPWRSWRLGERSILLATPADAPTNYGEKGAV